ncbi:MFS general substrate transporter [Ceratobasidium sp. AG-I]|nr:MFS general substrate transporter [Ceratobasidium sp. AG-I]
MASAQPMPVELSPAPTLVSLNLNATEKPEEAVVQEQSLASARPFRKYVLLAIFCLGQFLDTMNNSAMFPALPAMTAGVGLIESDTVWLTAAYQATFASFLLISGRISDIYAPKPAFIVGTAFFGAISLGAGFVNDRILLIVLRALQGIGASLTIPSALSLIVQTFPDPSEQARAIGFFGAAAAIGNVFGTLIGAILIQYASWRWIFWFIALIALPIAASCLYLIPKTPSHASAKASQLDFVGVSTLIAAIILFIYALTTGSVSSWKSAGVLAPFFISIALIIAFFLWEAYVDEKNASLPPKLWFYKNFAVLFALAFVPYFWWTQVYLTFSPYWQEDLQWSAIITGVKFLPIGIFGGAVMLSGAGIAKLGRPKMLIIGGLTLALAASIMLPFSANLRDRYWPLVFPALIIGTMGNAAVFVLTNITIFQTTPAEYAGTVGAVLNAALQLGAAIGTSATTSIQASVDQLKESQGLVKTGFEGRSAALWFLVAFVGLELIGFAVFYRPQRSLNDLEAKTLEGDASDMKEVDVGVKIQPAEMA